mgnify:CR=1 FL=1
MNIIVKIKSVYNKDLIYPVCHKAKLFARISGATDEAKTLTPQTIRKIKELGYEIAVETQTL